MRRGLLILAGSISLFLAAACGHKPESNVVLYCATDQHTAEKIVRLFEKETGIPVKARYDTEANKTVGLVMALMEEAKNPRADVFWNNEIIHTIRLAKAGILGRHDWPSAKGIEERWKDGEGRFAGFAARARVLIVNTEKMPDPKTRPKSIWDLVDPKFRGKGVMARPLTGTTLTHVAALFQTLGEKEARRFLDGLKANEVALAKSNGAVMRMVSAKEGPAFGLTDTDDFQVALRKGFPVIAVYPDQEGMGTFVIPNTVALIEGGPNPMNAKKLADFLCSAKVEAILAKSASAQIPLHEGAEVPEGVRPLSSFKAATWDFAKAAAVMDKVLPELRKRFGI
jgi:iron(III) transport system substrate-binding protein